MLKSFLTVGGFTMLSRVLGFVRDVMIAGLLGTGPMADAFFAAFRFPNLFRRLFAEGAFNMAFIPLFAKKLEGEGKESAKAFATETFSGLFTVLFIFTLLAQLTMPWLIYIIASGFAQDSAKLELTILFARIEFPYLMFMSLAALFSGVLNSFGRFAAAAAAPVLLNITLITVMASAYFMGWPIGHALAWGVAFGGVLQLGLVYMAAQKIGMGLKLQRPRMTPDMKRLIQLGIPGAISGGVTQINLLISSQIASYFAGAMSILNYADRVYQLPLGVVGIAIGVVLLPELARRVRKNDVDGTQKAMDQALEFSMLLTLPATIALIVIAHPIISVLFERGAFSAEATQDCAIALALFACGLPAYVLIKVLSPAYFAREDTKTPLNFAMISMAINITLSLIGAYFISWLAIPLGTAIASWVNVILLWRGMYRFGGYQPSKDIWRRMAMAVVASIGMGLILYALNAVFDEWLLNSWLKVIALLIMIFAGMVTFAIIGQLSGAFTLARLKQSFRR